MRTRDAFETAHDLQQADSLILFVRKAEGRQHPEFVRSAVARRIREWRTAGAALAYREMQAELRSFNTNATAGELAAHLADIAAKAQKR